MANAGFASAGEPALSRLVESYASFDRIVVLSGSCALHIRDHAGEVAGANGARDAGSRVAARTSEFCAFLHDDIGVAAVAGLGAEFPRRVALHIGCHALRGLGLARPSEIQLPPFNKVRALLTAVRGLELGQLERPDECCGFGGTFAVGEPAISVKMGRDRLREYRRSRVEAVVSTDMSCLMHLEGVARRDAVRLPMLHVAEVLASA
jgi:L-lactate dehydrogenase complex protein LldE